MLGTYEEDAKTIREVVCKGCKIYESYGTCCYIPTVYKHTCPCSICLIKMVCVTDKACNKMDMYRSVVEIYKEVNEGE